MPKIAGIDPGLPDQTAGAVFDLETRTFDDFWKYPSTPEEVKALKDHSNRISAAIGINVDLLGMQGEERSFYELANERNRAAGLVFQQKLKELMKTWLQDPRRMVFTKKRGPRRAVRTASARKRKSQRQATRVLIMTWREYVKWIDLNFTSTVI